MASGLLAFPAANDAKLKALAPFEPFKDENPVIGSKELNGPKCPRLPKVAANAAAVALALPVGWFAVNCVGVLGELRLL